MKIIVLGSGGMLGHLTTFYLKERGYEIENISHRFKLLEDTKLIDIMNIKKIEAYLDKSKPDVIINCIALLIRQADIHKDRAVYVNSFFSQWLGEKYKNTHTKIIYVSTDGVFSGEKGSYEEQDKSDATTFYGKTKYLGEIYNHKDLNVRSGFWGPDIRLEGIGLMNWFMKQNREAKGYCNVIFNGVTSLEFAKFVELAIQENISGIYHLTAQNPISKYALLEHINQCIRKERVTLNKEYHTVSNHVLMNTRRDIPYNPKSYEFMLEEIKCWIHTHGEFYRHY